MSNQSGHDPLPLRFCSFFHYLSALNSLPFQSYWDLKIWPKRVFRGKFCYYKWTFSVITIVLVIFWSGNLLRVSLLGCEIQKSHLEDLKINQSYTVLKISGSQYLWQDWCQKIHVTEEIIEKKNFSSFSIDLNLSLSQKWLLFLF